MAKFKFDNCTSKQFVRHHGWIPEASERMKCIAAAAKRPESVRRLRYLTFCAEGAMDVLALRNAKIIRVSGGGLYDTVVFFDFAPQAVDRTLQIIEGANGIPIDFFKLMSLEYEELLPNEADNTDNMPRDRTEGDETFIEESDKYLYSAFQREFPFDLINLDVERYLIKPSEELPGALLYAWDKICDWQKRKRAHEKRDYRIDGFTLFFTTKVGPRNLPEAHRDDLLNVLDHNMDQRPQLRELLMARFATADTKRLYEVNLDEFLKLAVPKALVSRALSRDWILDPERSYRCFEFDREPPKMEPYTMLHFILHFRRCEPSIVAQMNPQKLPEAVKTAYEASVETIFATDCEDVDELKVAEEAELREQLEKLGATV